jgi:hypothetical protein
MADLAFFAGAFVAVYLVSRLMLFLTKRMKDSAARLPVAYSLTLLFTVVVGGYGLSGPGKGPAFGEAFRQYVLPVGLWYLIDFRRLRRGAKVTSPGPSAPDLDPQSEHAAVPLGMPHAPSSAPRWHAWVAIPIGILCYYGAKTAVENARTRWATVHATPFERMALAIQDSIAADPSRMAKFSGLRSDEARARGEALAARGVARLRGRERVDRAALLGHVYALAPEATCHSFARGLPGVDRIVLVAKLDADEVRHWFVLSFHAMQAEVRNDPPRVSADSAALVGAARAVYASLPASEQDRFVNVISGEAVRPGEACAVARAMYRRVAELDGEAQDAYVGALQVIESAAVH